MITEVKRTLVLICQVLSLLGALLYFWTDIIVVHHSYSIPPLSLFVCCSVLLFMMVNKDILGKHLLCLLLLLHFNTVFQVNLW